MFRNYLKIAIRSLLKQFSYTAINVLGLTVGIASFLLIMLYIQYHLGFDRQIPEGEQFYRVVQIQQAEGVGEQHVAVHMGPLAEAMVREIPEVTDALRIMLGWGSQTVRVGESFHLQQNVAWTDRPVFRLLGVRLLEGDTATALAEPRSVVLSETTAEKYFGSIDKALGQLLDFNGEGGYVVTAVMEDQPKNSHLWMDVLVSFESVLVTYPWLKNWDSNSMPVYVRLSHDADYHSVAEKITSLVEKYRDPDNHSPSPKMYLQPLHEVHLKSGHIKFQVNFLQGDFRMIIMFVVVAILVLLIACINFINLAIARSVKRAKEVGVRKVMGANRMNLVYQFLGESVIISLLSILFALVLVEISLPEFNRLLDTGLRMDFVTNPLFNIGLVAIWLSVSLLSGTYPAFFMSRYQAVEVLKGSRRQGSRLGGWLGKGLVVFQFSVAIVLIFVVIVSVAQIRYVLNKDLGYQYDHVLGIFLPERKSAQFADALIPQLKQMTGIQGIAKSSYINGVAGNQSTIEVADSAKSRIMVRFGYVDEDFFPLMGIQLVAGRNFSRNYPNDYKESVILNEAAVKYLGWENPIGMRFEPMGFDTLNRRTVIGVIKDYHYYSVHSKIEPAAYVIYPEGFGMVCVKYESGASAHIEADIEKEWKALFPSTPFRTVFAKTRIENQYANDKNTLQLFIMFTVLSLLISSMGLYGLTALNVEQRTREIGIRKVLGGSVNQIMQLVFKEFVGLIALAGLIAIPLGYYFSGQILDKFAYNISIGWYVPVMALLSALVIAVLTILYHAGKAARANPINALKYE